MVEFTVGLRAVVSFLLSRYPFFNALTLLLLLAERASRETDPPFNVLCIYVCVAVLFLSGFCMGFDSICRPAALVHAVQLLFMAALVFWSDSLKYRHWVKLRMSHRMVGVAGYYILYAYFKSLKPREKWFRTVGQLFIGIYILASAYILLQSPEDKEAFLRFIPGGRPILFVYATMLATVGLCYLPGQFVYDVTAALAVLLSLSTLLVDARLSYWTKQRGIDYWNQLRMIGDNVAIIAGAVFFLATSKKKHLKSD